MGLWIMIKYCCLGGAQDGFFFRMMDGRFIIYEWLVARQKGKIEWSLGGKTRKQEFFIRDR